MGVAKFQEARKGKHSMYSMCSKLKIIFAFEGENKEIIESVTYNNCSE